MAGAGVEEEVRGKAGPVGAQVGLTASASWCDGKDHVIFRLSCGLALCHSWILPGSWGPLHSEDAGGGGGAQTPCQVGSLPPGPSCFFSPSLSPRNQGVLPLGPHSPEPHPRSGLPPLSLFLTCRASST